MGAFIIKQLQKALIPGGYRYYEIWAFEIFFYIYFV